MARRASPATGGFPAALAAAFWVVDGLAHRLEPAAQQLLGHGDLLGPQRGQHGVAVHGRGGRDRTLAAGRAPVALAGAAAPGPAWTAAAAAAPPGRSPRPSPPRRPSRVRGGRRGGAAAALRRVPRSPLVVATPLARARGEDHRHVGRPLGACP